MNTDPHILAREDFIMPSMVALDYTHRGSFVDGAGNVNWRWFKSIEEAHEWLADFVAEPTEEDWCAEEAAHQARKDYRANRQRAALHSSGKDAEQGKEGRT